jgi:cytoskeletal protein RodZ
LESLGGKLKAAREERELSFDQIARDTNISVRYLEALEAENFNNFPGEPYITGFLRTYGAYLGLEPQELISLYRAHKIQEQPVPVEQLLEKPSPLPKIALVAAIVAVVGAAAGGGYYFFTRPRKPAVQTPAERTAAEYAMTGDSLERRMYPGDAVLVPLGDSQYKLELESLGDAVAIRTPSGVERLNLGQSASIDLRSDGIANVQITVVDFARDKADMGALLNIELISAVAGAVEPDIDIPAANQSAYTVVFSSPNAYPFTLQSGFQGYCLFRWQILREPNRSGRNEQYFQRADELNIQAQNGIRVWASNAQAAKFQIIGGGRTVPVELGGSGEVVVADIHWVRDAENRFRLVIARLEI